ncbi:MAG TPA: hydroxymethylbilane synthase [Candidatus Limnocylindria bacterium]|nr:hydroxymethylbilane synthase [Candidatus Limnocylindria bacterium]
MTLARSAARLRLGTRASNLARTQSAWVAERLREAHPGLFVELVPISTSGDRRSEGRLANVGGKGLFLKEIEDALLAGEVDFAVHSMKDVPAALPAGLALAAVPPRADARDVVIGTRGAGLTGLRQGARVGTSSVRRRIQLLALRPDLDVVVLRGNVETRLARVRDGTLDAVVLAAAGLARLGLGKVDAVPLEPADFLPAVGQGALALEYRADDVAVGARLDAIGDPDATAAVAAERGFLAGIGGDCSTPLAAHAWLSGGEVVLRAMVADEQGTHRLDEQAAAPRAEAAALGRAVAERLLARGAGRLLRP